MPTQVETEAQETLDTLISDLADMRRVVDGLNARSLVRAPTKTIVFTGAAGAGAVGEIPVYALTGRVVVVINTQFCTQTLTQAAPTASISFGTASAVTLLVSAPPTGGVTDIVAGDFWASAQSVASMLFAASNYKLLSENPIFTIATQNCTGGVLVCDMWYYPITPGATLL